MKDKHVLAIATDDIDVVWDAVRPSLQLAMDTYLGAVLCDLGFVHNQLTKGQSELFVAFDDDNGISGGMVVCYETYPDHKLAYVQIMGGRGLCTKDNMQQFKEWMRLRNVTVIRAHSNDSVTRLYRKFGLIHTADLTELVL